MVTGLGLKLLVILDAHIDDGYWSQSIFLIASRRATESGCHLLLDFYSLPDWSKFKIVVTSCCDFMICVIFWKLGFVKTLSIRNSFRD